MTFYFLISLNILCFDMWFIEIIIKNKSHKFKIKRYIFLNSSIVPAFSSPCSYLIACSTLLYLLEITLMLTVKFHVLCLGTEWSLK